MDGEASPAKARSKTVKAMEVRMEVATVVEVRLEVHL